MRLRRPQRIQGSDGIEFRRPTLCGRDHRPQGFQVRARFGQPACAQGRGGRLGFFRSAAHGNGLKFILGIRSARRRLPEDLPPPFAEHLAQLRWDAFHCEAEALTRLQFIPGRRHESGELVVTNLPQVALMPIESRGLNAFPAALGSVVGEVHDAHMGVQLRVECPVGVMGDDGRHHIAGATVEILTGAPHAGRGQRFHLPQRLRHRFLPPAADPVVATH